MFVRYSLPALALVLAVAAPVSAKPPKNRQNTASTTAEAAPVRAPKVEPLRPQREPLLARSPAATCTPQPLEVAALEHHARTRESLREFYWSNMAKFFDDAPEDAEPTPRQVTDTSFVATATILSEFPEAVRRPLQAIAAARLVDRLDDRVFAKISRLLASLRPQHVARLLQADAPTLRAYVWTWLATTKAGGCQLGHLDLGFVEAAVGDRSVAVEHGDDLVFRALGDYALAARVRLAGADPARFDQFLARVATAAEVDPLVRATASAMLQRRSPTDLHTQGLADPSPPVRAATALATLDRHRDRVVPELLEHAAHDPDDLVTEAIVAAVLGLGRGPLTTTKDPRLAAAVGHLRGRLDPLTPLPSPRAPLTFAATPRESAVTWREPAAPEPVREPTPASAAPDVVAQPTTSVAARPSTAAEPPALPGIYDDLD